jgi:anti-anti-sigma regulatory factor
VTGITPKVRTIAELGGFDTIAVTTDNVPEAYEALAGKLRAIRVVDIADPQAQ